MKLKIDSTYNIYLVAENIQDKVYIHKFCKDADKNLKPFFNIAFKAEGVAGMSNLEDYEETEDREAKYNIEDITELEISIINI